MKYVKGGTGTRAYRVQGIHWCVSRCQVNEILYSVVFPIFGGKIYITKFIISTILHIL